MNDKLKVDEIKTFFGDRPFTSDELYHFYKHNKIYSGVNPEFIEGDVFKTIIPLTIQGTNQDTNQDNEAIKGLLEFCRTPRTREEMQQFMGLNNRVILDRKDFIL